MHVCVSVCVRVDLLIQHATRIRHIVASLAPPHFSTLSYKRHEVRKKSYWTYNVCFDFLYMLSKALVILRRIQRDIVVNVKTFSCKVLVILTGFERNLNFPNSFKKKLKYQISSKSVHWEPGCSIQADGQTVRQDEANSRFSSFCERAWKEGSVLWSLTLSCSLALHVSKRIPVSQYATCYVTKDVNTFWKCFYCQTTRSSLSAASTDVLYPDTPSNDMISNPRWRRGLPLSGCSKKSLSFMQPVLLHTPKSSLKS